MRNKCSFLNLLYNGQTTCYYTVQFHGLCWWAKYVFTSIISSPALPEAQARSAYVLLMSYF